MNNAKILISAHIATPMAAMAWVKHFGIGKSFCPTAANTCPTTANNCPTSANKRSLSSDKTKDLYAIKPSPAA